MQQIATFDPNSPPAGQKGGSFATNYLSSGIGYLVMWNMSNWEIDLTFPNGDIDVLPAWTAQKYHLHGPSGNVQWAQDTQLVVNNTPPISQCKVVAYRENEDVPGVYPVAIILQLTIGNDINILSAANVSNTNQPPNTSIVYGLPVGDNTALGCINIENSGFIQVGDSHNQGQITLSGPSGKSTTITNDQVQAPQVSAGEVFFSIGSIANLALVGPTTIANAGTSVAHNLNVVPDMVLCIRDLASASADVITVNFSTMTSTHFTAYSSNAGGSVNCRFFLIKF